MNRRHAFLIFLMAVAAVLILWTSRTSPRPAEEPGLIPPETVYPDSSQAPPEQTSTLPSAKAVGPADTGNELIDDEIVASLSFSNLGCRRAVTRSLQGREQIHVGCGRLAGHESSVYTKSSSDELETLAQTDAEAAMMLALRSQSFDKPRTLKYAVRATALGSNDATPLLWYMSNVRPPRGSAPGRRSGVEAAKMNYVLSKVAESLGADPRFSRHAHWQLQLSEAALDADAVEALNQHSTNMLAQIKRIQNEAGIAPTTAE